MRVKPKVVYHRLSGARSSRLGAKPEIIVVHSTESHNRPGDSDLRSIADFFDSGVEASSHVIIDDDGHSARCVPDGEKAWTVGNLNRISLNAEMIGQAAQRDWSLSEVKEMARWIAQWSIEHGIPIRKAVLTSGGSVVKSGVTTHRYCSAHGAGTSHWDPGYHFPMRKCLRYARLYKAARLHRK